MIYDVDFPVDFLWKKIPDVVKIFQEIEIIYLTCKYILLIQ